MLTKNHNIKRYLVQAVIGGAIALISFPLKASEYELGLKALNKGHYTKAFQMIKLSSDKGEIQSHFLLSTMYRRGLGVEKDEYKGFYWCKKAAEEGYLEAQFQLGLMYLEGEGVTEDDAEAQEWLWAAADRGYPQATEVLTYIYSDDYGIGC